MRRKKIEQVGILVLLLMTIMMLIGIVILRHTVVQGAISEHNLVDGAPRILSSCAAPDDTKAGGYDDAVEYNDYTCDGKSSTWNYKNGYVFWSTKSKVATKTEATLFRSIGWDILFSADVNGNRRIDASEQLQISVARTIKGEYQKKMNYYYIHYQQKETDGVLYNYSLYAMSYDRLKELAMNRNPNATAIFSCSQINMEIDGIMTVVERDADGNEKIRGEITAENVDGTITTTGAVYHCRNAEDYDYLTEHFNSSSIATYKNKGAIANNKLTMEFYVDVNKYPVKLANGWSINQSNGQIYYNGKPYTKEHRFWEVVQIKDFKDILIGDGYSFTGAWRCGNLSCYLKDNETFHTSYLAQFASFDPRDRGIYAGDGVLKLYADTITSWEANGYTIEYYTKTSKNAKSYEKIATQNCKYGTSYKFYSIANTSSPVLEGVNFLAWAVDGPENAERVKAKASFSDETFPKVRNGTGTIIRLYALWEVTCYTITYDENLPTGSKSHQFYEIYNVGFTTEKSLANTKNSTDPFYWMKSSYLLSASELQLDQLIYESYIWNGYWDKQIQVQYFNAGGKALFSSAQTFEQNMTIWGNWKKNYTLTILYQVGNDVIVDANAKGYGVDASGYLTESGKRISKQYQGSEEVTILEVPSCIRKTGNTRPTKWQFQGTDESVKGSGIYTARTLAKKVGEDIGKNNVTVILELPWNIYKYYVDYYFWNNKSGKYEIYASQTCTYGGTYTFYSEQNVTGIRIPTGKVFGGWSTKEGDNIVAYRAGERFSNLSSKSNGRISLYGVWGGMTYRIELKGNCPFDSEQPVEMGTSEISYVFGEGFYQNGRIQKECSIQIPSCPGYVFLGYYPAQTGGLQMFDTQGKSTSQLSYNTISYTLYAQWAKRTYRMTYNANGGTFAKNNFGDATIICLEGIAYGSFLPQPIAPQKEGYSFDGYERNSDGEVWYNRFLNSANRKYDVAADVTLYAKWVDDIVPTGTIRASAGNSRNAWTNQNVQLQITGADSGSGVVKMQLFQKRYNESKYQLIGEWTSEPVKNMTQNLMIETNGISNFYCVIYDARGNSNYRIWGTPSDRFGIKTTTVYIDKTPPRITVPVIKPVRSGDEGVEISLYASDDVIE